MKESIFIAIIIVLIYIFLFINRSSLRLIETHNRKVLVRNSPNYLDHAILLSQLINNMYKLRDYMIANKSSFPEFIQYINLLEGNFNEKRTRIYENSPYSNYT